MYFQKEKCLYGYTFAISCRSMKAIDLCVSFAICGEEQQ